MTNLDEIIDAINGNKITTDSTVVKFTIQPVLNLLQLTGMN